MNKITKQIVCNLVDGCCGKKGGAVAKPLIYWVLKHHKHLFLISGVVLSPYIAFSWRKEAMRNSIFPFFLFNKAILNFHYGKTLIATNTCMHAQSLVICIMESLFLFSSLHLSSELI